MKETRTIHATEPSCSVDALGVRGVRGRHDCLHGVVLLHPSNGGVQHPTDISFPDPGIFHVYKKGSEERCIEADINVFFCGKAIF